MDHRPPVTMVFVPTPIPALASYTLETILVQNAEGPSVLVVYKGTVYDIRLFLDNLPHLRDAADEGIDFEEGQEEETASTLTGDSDSEGGEDEDEDEEMDVDPPTVPQALLDQTKVIALTDPLHAGRIFASLCPFEKQRDLWKVGFLADEINQSDEHNEQAGSEAGSDAGDADNNDQAEAAATDADAAQDGTTTTPAPAPSTQPPSTTTTTWAHFLSGNLAQLDTQIVQAHDALAEADLTVAAMEHALAVARAQAHARRHHLVQLQEQFWHVRQHLDVAAGVAPGHNAAA